MFAAATVRQEDTANKSALAHGGRHTASVASSAERSVPATLCRNPRDNRSVVPAEAEAVAHHRAQAALARAVRRVVEITRRVGRLVVDRRRADAVDNRLHAEDQLHAAARAEQVAYLALGAGDAHLVGVLAEDCLDGDRLGRIAQP